MIVFWGTLGVATLALCVGAAIALSGAPTMAAAVGIGGLLLAVWKVVY
jgi:hypothetical protein